MAPLEIKRMQLELVRVQTAKMEMEFKIEEKLDEIQRIKDNIKVQEKRIDEVKEMLANK